MIRLPLAETAPEPTDDDDLMADAPAAEPAAVHAASKRGDRTP
jgi:hypothetical protein